MIISPLKISVVVICNNEEKYIKNCLKSIDNLNYKKNLFEVIIVENCSEDNTNLIIREFIKTKPNMRIINSLKKGISVNRNIGINNSNHDYIAFIDADCTAEENWLRNLDNAFREELLINENIAAVGGPNIMPLGSNKFRQSLAIAVSNYWGNHGSAQGANYQQQRMPIDHLPTLNIMYDKKKVLEIGGFDEQQGNVCEDVDLNTRLIWKGYNLRFDSRAIVRHEWRDSFYAWAKAVATYGKGRSWLMKKNKKYFKFKLLAPIFLVFSAISSTFFKTNLLFAAPFVTYLTLTTLITIMSSFSHKKPQYIFHIFLIYLITHLAYGIGQIYGFFAKRGSD